MKLRLTGRQRPHWKYTQVLQMAISGCAMCLLCTDQDGHVWAKASGADNHGCRAEEVSCVEGCYGLAWVCFACKSHVCTC